MTAVACGRVAEPLGGSVHDRKTFAECDWEGALGNTPVITDSRYPGTYATTPRKKPPSGKLSTKDKADNKAISSIRSAVERRIAHLKNWKTLATGYQGRLAKPPAVIRIITTLQVYHLEQSLMNNAQGSTDIPTLYNILPATFRCRTHTSIRA